MYMMFIMSLFCGDANWIRFKPPIFHPIKKDEIKIAGNKIYILNYDQSQIYCYNSRGEQLSAIGFKGEGPGGLIHPDTFFVENETVYVQDKGNDQITVFTADGIFKERFRLPKRKLILCKVKNGWVVGDWKTTSDEDPPAVYLVDLHFKDIRKLFDITERGVLAGVVVHGRGEKQQVQFTPVTTRPMMAGDPRGEFVYLTQGTSGKIIKIDVPTASFKTFVKPVSKRIPFDKDWAEGQLAIHLEASKDLPPRNKISADFPERFPVIRELGITPEGQLMVTRWMGDPQNNKPITLYNQDGTQHQSKHNYTIFERYLGLIAGLAVVSIYDDTLDVAGIALGPVSELVVFLNQNPIVYEGAVVRIMGRSD